MADLLLSNAAATGAAKSRAAVIYTFAVDGTFNGATVALEMKSPDGSSWLAISGASFTAEGAVNVELPSNSYRASVTGGPPSGIYASLNKAGNG